MNLFASHTSDVNNATVVFKKFNIPQKINIFNQGKNLETFKRALRPKNISP